MQRPHPFRFKRVKRKNGRIYVVVYDHNPSQPVPTGIPVHPEDTREGGPGLQDAISWAYANMELSQIPLITIKEATADMFTESCAWRRRMERKNRTFSSTYFQLHRGRLENYIWPKWGAYQPSKVTAPAIDNWLFGLKRFRSGKDLASGAIDKLIQTLRIVFDECEYQGLVAQGRNPARLVDYNAVAESKREPITIEEFRKLFPDDIDELTRIWGTLSWATFFYIMATCGLRPGEVAAFDISRWVPETGYACAQTIDAKTREVKGLKTAKKGMAVKPAYLNKRAESLLTMLLYSGAPASGLLFTVNGNPIVPETSNKHFKASCTRAGVPPGDRTQYSLRHFYATEMAKHLPEREVAEYLGQRVYRTEYDHRKVLERLKSNKVMRQWADRLF